MLCGCSAAGEGDGVNDGDPWAKPADSKEVTLSGQPELPESSAAPSLEGFFEEPALGEYAEPACDAGKYVYLMTAEKAMLRFDPTSLRTEFLGAIDCATDSTTNSMAVDRQGNAWVGFHSGEIFRVSTETLDCEPSGYAPAQLGWSSFGMAFVADSAGSAAETLFLAEGGPVDPVFAGIGRVERDQLRLRSVGAFRAPIEGRWCDLTGSGEGRLFALCPGAPTRLAEVDKATAVTVSVTELPFKDVTAFALAHWAGDFIVFTATDGGSRVDSVRPGEGSLRIVESMDYVVVGAGVSTCAPTWSEPR